MKRRDVRIGVVLALALMLGADVSFGQKGSGGGGSSSASSGGGGGGGGGQGGQSGGAQAGGSSAASPSGRIEASMLAYEASDKIAAHIADQVKGHTLYIYDTQTFASLQAYEASQVTVSAFEVSFGLFKSPPKGTQPQSTFETAAPVVQTALTALRSTAEYAGETVNLQTDPVIAQVANHSLLLGNSVVIPKFLFVSADDLKSSDTATLQTTVNTSDVKASPSCADLSRTLPDQLGCLLLVRNAAATWAAAGTTSQQAAFAALDKLFQVFFGTLMGTSVNLSSSTSAPAGGAGGGGTGGGGTGNGGGATSNGGNQTGNQSVSVPLLSQLIQGHRLKAQFSKDTNSRVLVLEATEGGGGSRIKHIFFAELFWTTPTPTFTGGSIVTYLLIDPATSKVEKSEVLRFTVDYGKFHGNKIETASNF